MEKILKIFIMQRLLDFVKANEPLISVLAKNIGGQLQAKFFRKSVHYLEFRYLKEIIRCIKLQNRSSCVILLRSTELANATFRYAYLDGKKTSLF